MPSCILAKAPGISQIQLEAIALNVAGVGPSKGGEYESIEEGAPIAYRTHYPVGIWAGELRSLGVPANVSYHAGTYLCNAAMFLSHHWFSRRHEKPLCGFMHLPLSPDQATGEFQGIPSMPTSIASQAVGHVVDRILRLSTQSPTEFA